MKKIPGNGNCESQDTIGKIKKKVRIKVQSLKKTNKVGWTNFCTSQLMFETPTAARFYFVF